MIIEAEDEEVAYRKACHFLGLDPQLQKTLELTLSLAERYQRLADTAKEGAEVGAYLNAVAALKYIHNDCLPECPQFPDDDNVIPFSESYRRPKHDCSRLSRSAEEYE